MYKPVDLQIQFLYQFSEAKFPHKWNAGRKWFFFIVTYNYLPWAHVDNLYGRIS